MISCSSAFAICTAPETFREWQRLTESGDHRSTPGEPMLSERSRTQEAFTPLMAGFRAAISKKRAHAAVESLTNGRGLYYFYTSSIMVA